jgi:hypothetical protein
MIVYTLCFSSTSVCYLHLFGISCEQRSNGRAGNPQSSLGFKVISGNPTRFPRICSLLSSNCSVTRRRPEADLSCKNTHVSKEGSSRSSHLGFDDPIIAQGRVFSIQPSPQSRFTEASLIHHVLSQWRGSGALSQYFRSPSIKDSDTKKGSWTPS